MAVKAQPVAAGEQGAAVDVNGRLIVVEDDGTIIIGPGREQPAAAARVDARGSAEVEYLTGERAGSGLQPEAGSLLQTGLVQVRCLLCCLLIPNAV